MPNTKDTLTYDEREKIKRFAYEGKELKSMLLALAYWQGCGLSVSFSEYAAQWAVAHAEDLEAIKELFPLTGPRFIAHGGTEYGGYVAKHQI